MRAMRLEELQKPLKETNCSIPQPQQNQLLIKIHACGICRTDLHVVDGDLTQPKLPVTPGHQIVGTVQAIGPHVENFKLGQRVGVTWLGQTCGTCEFCLTDRENLCDSAQFTGYQIDGGFAEYCVANYRYCFPIPDGYPDHQVAPLLCAGIIGYRALEKTQHAMHLGLFGFGSAAHILIQVARYQGRHVYAFTRPGDTTAQEFAMQLGADWAGDSDQATPRLLDSAIIFAPVGELIPLALRAVKKGGIVVCAGIHMSDIPSFSYDILWGERSICSVANLTRENAEAFLALAPKIPIQTEVTTYPLNKTNEALDDLRHGRFSGSGVIVL